MADRKPLKVLPDGGGDSTGLGEFVAADTVGVVDGGTGLDEVGANRLLTGNGTSALTSEANLTFDGSSNTLTVTGDQHIANGGALVVGNTAQVATNTITAETQIQGTANADATMSVSRYSADTTPPRIHLAKSRNGLGDVEGAVQSGDSLGQLVFCGSDGTDFNNMGAFIECAVTGSVLGDTIPAAMTFHTNAGSSIAERLRIDASGDVTISDGDLVIGTAGHGIDFSATSDGAGTDSSELLDDYEEGTFTPTLGAHTSNGTHSYTTQVGNYTKVGNVVHIWLKLVINTLNTSGAISGNLEISGLPYTSANTTGQAYMGTFLPVGLDMDSGTGPVVMMGINQARLSLVAAVDDASYDTFTSADVASGDGFWIQFSYPV